MSILDDIVGRRVLVHDSDRHPNFIGTVVGATATGLHARHNEKLTYYYPWRCVVLFLEDANFRVGCGVVNLYNPNVLGTIWTMGQHYLWVDVNRSPHLCHRPPEGYWCPRPSGHDGPCPTFSTGQPYQDDRANWSRIIYRPEGLEEYLTNPAPPVKVLSRFEIMEDL